MRARLALAVSRQAYALREVVLRSKPLELLRASSKGTVPVLVLVDGTVIDQSLDIMLWALRQNDPQGWLSPPDGGLEAMLGLIQVCDGPFKHHLDRYKYPERYEGHTGAEHREAASEWLFMLEARLSAQTALCGDCPALADAAIMPFVRQFAQVDRAWFDAQPWPALRGWLEGWLASPLFHAVMVKHEPWATGEGVLYPEAFDSV